MDRPVRVVGAGFSGLTTSYYLRRRELHVELFEAQARPGGMLQTTQTPLGLVESAANGILCSSSLEEMAKDAGIQLMASGKESRNRYILRDGSARRWPLSFWESVCAIWNFIKARFSKLGRAPQKFETIANWGTRVLGAPLTERMMAPALQGIYAGDHKRLSASLIVGRFFESKPKVKGPAPRFSGTVAPAGGMGEFAVKLRNRLVAEGVIYKSGQTVTAEDVLRWKAEGSDVVIALPAPAAAELVKTFAPKLAEKLSRIEMIPIVTVTMFYPSEAARLRGFGCLIPRNAGFTVLGVLFNNFIFPGRAKGHSETWIFGEKGSSDTELLARIQRERRELYKGIDDEPVDHKITRWPAALPHYTVELEKLLPDIMAEAKAAGVYLMGNYLGSLGLGRILVKAQETAAAVYANQIEEA